MQANPSGPGLTVARVAAVAFALAVLGAVVYLAQAAGQEQAARQAAPLPTVVPPPPTGAPATPTAAGAPAPDAGAASAPDAGKPKVFLPSSKFGPVPDKVFLPSTKSGKLVPAPSPALEEVLKGSKPVFLPSTKAGPMPVLEPPQGLGVQGQPAPRQQQATPQ